MDDWQGVLDFWLNEVGEADWYSGGEDLDERCRNRWIGLWGAARQGQLHHWCDTARGALAFLILTDQLPRNMHRGRAEAFATDAMARDAARMAIAKGWDFDIPQPERQFFYLPIEHSEAIADQDWAVALISVRLAEETEVPLHARAHREVIRRFGRFPARNAALGRESTAEETAFLTEGGYAAILRSLRS